MASVNKVILVGNLGQDPEVRFTANGQCVATLNIATSENWTNKQNGQKEEKTEWHRVVLWGRLGELARDYLAKGRSVYIEGKLQTRKWEDKQGQTKYTTEIVGQTMQFLGSGPGAGAAKGRGESPETVGATASSGASDEPPAFTEDDVPF